MKWNSFPQMVELQTTKLIHQIVVTGQPASLSTKLPGPAAGMTRGANRANLRILNRRKMLSKQTFSYKGVQSYNQLDLSIKISGKSKQFSRYAKQFIKNSRSKYLHQYQLKLTKPSITVPSTCTDVILLPLPDGSLSRERVKLRDYLGK